MPESIPVVGVPVADAPMGSPVESADEVLRRGQLQIREAAKAAEDRIFGEIHRAGEFERSQLERCGLAAQARVESSVNAAVAASINRQLPTALAAHIASSDGVRRLAIEVEAQVERNARKVVARLAGEEVARRSLSVAIEERCMTTIDQRTSRLFWTSGLIGATTGALVAYWLPQLKSWYQRRGD